MVTQVTQPQKKSFGQQVTFVPDYTNLSVLMRNFQRSLDERCATAIKEQLPQDQKNQATHSVFEKNIPELTGQTPAPEIKTFASDAVLQDALVAEMFEALYVRQNPAALIGYLAAIDVENSGVDNAVAIAKAKQIVAELQTPEAELMLGQLKTETQAELAIVAAAPAANSNGAEPPSSPPENELDDENFKLFCQEKAAPLTPMQQQRLEKIQAEHKIYVMAVDKNNNRRLYTDAKGAMAGFNDNQDMLQTKAQNKVTAAVGQKMQQDISPEAQTKKELVETVISQIFRFENSITRRDLTTAELKDNGLDKENMRKLVTTTPKAALTAA